MIQTISISEQFLTTEVPVLLSKLKREATPKWGIMTAQHMAEHLINSILSSNGKRVVNLVTPAEQLEARRGFLLGPLPFQKNIRTATGGTAILSDLKLPDLDTAKSKLLSELEGFFTYFEGHDGIKPMNAIYGELTKPEWMVFHQKHIRHHFTQFGLLE